MRNRLCLSAIGRRIVYLLLAVILAACSTVTETSTPTATLQPSPSPTATLEPLGALSNPLIIASVAGDDAQAAEDAAAQTGAQLTDLTGMSVRVHIFPDYSALIEALSSGQVHAAWLPPLTYLHARSLGLARVEYLANHFGVYQYGFQILVNAESGFSSYFDPQSGTNLADEITALAQLEGRRPCFTEASSISGAIAAAGLLNRNAVTTLPPVFTRSYTATIRALYIGGVCDFGTTFALSGDPRTSPAVTDDLPDAGSRVAVLWRSDALIPNLNFSTSPSLADDLRAALLQAVLDLSRQPAGTELLSQINNYSIEDLKPADDSVYQALNDLTQSAGIRLADHIGY